MEIDNPANKTDDVTFANAIIHGAEIVGIIKNVPLKNGLNDLKKISEKFDVITRIFIRNQIPCHISLEVHFDDSKEILFSCNNINSAITFGIPVCAIEEDMFYLETKYPHAIFTYPEITIEGFYYKNQTDASFAAVANYKLPIYQFENASHLNVYKMSLHYLYINKYGIRYD